MKSNFIQKALSKHKPGALHRQLGIPQDEVIPEFILVMIKEAPLGGEAHVTYHGHNKVMKVTPLLKKRAVLALTLRRINK